MAMIAIQTSMESPASAVVISTTTTEGFGTRKYHT